MEQATVTTESGLAIAILCDTVNALNEATHSMESAVEALDKATKARDAVVLAYGNAFDVSPLNAHIDKLSIELELIKGELNIEALQADVKAAFDAIPASVVEAFNVARKLNKPVASGTNSGGRKGTPVQVTYLDGSSSTYDSGAAAMVALFGEQWQGNGPNASKAWRSHAFNSKGELHARCTGIKVASITELNA